MGRNVGAGLRTERVRRDESRLYVADIPCGRRPGVGGRGGLEEARLSVTSGGAQRNPRWGDGWCCRPRRGRYARCRFWYRRLFEATYVSVAGTAGSASLHPRLLIARPLRGRPCCRMLYYLSAARVFNTQNRLFSHDCSVARKYAKIRNSSFSDTSLRCSATEVPKTRKNDAIWHKSTPKNPLESGLGSKIPWDGSADPWDGNGNRWDGWPRAPHPAAFPTLKRRQPWVSALTVCHIAHKAARHAPCHPPAGEKASLGGTPSWRPSPPGRPCAGEECRGAAAP